MFIYPFHLFTVIRTIFFSDFRKRDTRFFKTESKFIPKNFDNLKLLKKVSNFADQPGRRPNSITNAFVSLSIKGGRFK